MDENNRYIWLNEKIVNVNEAYINVLSPTSQFGANVFEGIRCYWNDIDKELYAFRLSDHYRRLSDSMKLFRISNNYTDEDYLNFLKQVVKVNEYQEDIAVRQTVFVDGMGSWFSCEPTGMFIAPVKKSRKSVPLTSAEKCCVSSYERISENDMSPRAKVGANYINSRLAKIEASYNGYDSALFLNREGFVAEGTGSCFFIIKDNKLIAPAMSESILQSITRDTLIKLGKQELGLEIEERRVTRTELYTCDEAFFCGSAVEIEPVGSIDGYNITGDIPGRITKELHALYLDVVSGKIQKYLNWLTPIYRGE